MILALLTTMNSKVKVHVVDGSKCVPDCSHDKERHPRLIWGPVWPSENKTVFGAGVGGQEAGSNTQRLRREGT